MMYATATERLLAAIGEPEMVDTSKDARLGRIFMNRTIRAYTAFSEFYGMEETLQRCSRMESSMYISNDVPWQRHSFWVTPDCGDNPLG